MSRIEIVKDFSDAPMGRYEYEGPFSGELFRKTLLKPKYLEAVEKKEKLTVFFDGAFGYSTSFLEESFGGLVRELKSKEILNNIDLISNDDITVQGLVKKYVRKAEMEFNKS
jgi:hypothetical protein